MTLHRVLPLEDFNFTAFNSLELILTTAKSVSHYLNSMEWSQQQNKCLILRELTFRVGYQMRFWERKKPDSQTSTPPMSPEAPELSSKKRTMTSDAHPRDIYRSITAFMACRF